MNPLLTFYRLHVSIGIGELCCDAQGAAVGTGLDAGGLEQQWFPVCGISQAYHLSRAATSLCFSVCMRTSKASNKEAYVSLHLNFLIFHSQHLPTNPC